MTYRSIGLDGVARGVADLAFAKVAVVGDVLTDRWVWGSVSRISPEAPVPVFLEERVEEMPGGCANVLHNIRALGAHAERPFTTKLSVKTRYVAGQHILRADKDDLRSMSADEQRRLMIYLERQEPHVLVISDYAKGVCTPDLCQRLIAWAKVRGIKVVVDPKGEDWSKYNGAHVLKSNLVEMRDGYRTNSDFEDVFCVMTTMGADGVRVEGGGEKSVDIPGRPVTVRDVCGAGDTFTATLACALAVGFDLIPAARLANAAASVAVSKSGTSTVSPAELEAALCE